MEQLQKLIKSINKDDVDERQKMLELKEKLNGEPPKVNVNLMYIFRSKIPSRCIHRVMMRWCCDLTS